MSDSTKSKLDSTMGAFLDQYDLDKEASSDKSDMIGDNVSQAEDKLHDKLDSTTSKIQADKTDKFNKYESREIMVIDEDEVPRPVSIADINTVKLRHLILVTERWRGFMFNLGYEANQMKKMLVKAEDATIKVRRLVRNFKDKMEEVERQVWDEDHKLRDDFSFTGMSASSLREIILLHDWYATNAPEKTPEDMGMNDDEFLEFRRVCNKIAYNLRKNQYAELLAVRKERLLNRMNELAEKMKDTNKLKWNDKYGWEAKKEEEKQWSLVDVTDKQKDRIEKLAFEEDRAEHVKKLDKNLQDELNGKLVRVLLGGSLKPWSLSDVTMEKSMKIGKAALNEDRANPGRKTLDQYLQAELNGENEDETIPLRTLGDWSLSDVSREQSIRINPFAEIEKVLKKDELTELQYKKDLAALERRTLDYLKEIGLIESDDDIEKLTARNRANNYNGNICAEIRKLEEARERMLKAKATMEGQRAALQSIIDSVYSAESKIQELEAANKKIFNQCLTEKNRQIRNRLLISKLENENQIVELKDAVKGIKKKHLSQFKSLEKMRKAVDVLQSELDSKIERFKNEIGLNVEAISNLMVAIYNRFQDEILEGVK